MEKFLKSGIVFYAKDITFYLPAYCLAREVKSWADEAADLQWQFVQSDRASSSTG